MKLLLSCSWYEWPGVPATCSNFSCCSQISLTHAQVSPVPFQHIHTHRGRLWLEEAIKKRLNRNIQDRLHWSSTGFSQTSTLSSPVLHTTNPFYIPIPISVPFALLPLSSSWHCPTDPLQHAELQGSHSHPLQIPGLPPVFQKAINSTYLYNLALFYVGVRKYKRLDRLF